MFTFFPFAYSHNEVVDSQLMAMTVFLLCCQGASDAILGRFDLGSFLCSLARTGAQDSGYQSSSSGLCPCFCDRCSKSFPWKICLWSK